MRLVHPQAPADLRRGATDLGGVGELVENARLRQGERARRQMPFEEADFAGVEPVEAAHLVGEGHGGYTQSVVSDNITGTQVTLQGRAAAVGVTAVTVWRPSGIPLKPLRRGIGLPGVNLREVSMPATIGPGSIGDDVKRLQRVLARHLLWNPFGPINGVFDATLETSVKSFQQSNGLTVDGVVGTRHLGQVAVLSRGLAHAVQRVNRSCGGVASASIEGRRHRHPVSGLRRRHRRPIRRQRRLAALQGLQTWANVPASGVVDDVTWFVWMAPGSAQQLTLEAACGLLNKLP